MVARVWLYLVLPLLCVVSWPPELPYLFFDVLLFLLYHNGRNVQDLSGFLLQQLSCAADELFGYSKGSDRAQSDFFHHDLRLHRVSQ